MTSVVARHQGLGFSGTGPITMTLDGSGTDRLIVAVISARNGEDVTLSGATIEGNAGTVVAQYYTFVDKACNTYIIVFNDAAHPGAGSASITLGTTLGTSAAVVYELQNAPQSAPFMTIDTTATSADVSEIVGGTTFTQTVAGQAGNLGIFFLGMADDSFWDSTVSFSGNLSNPQVTDGVNAHVHTAEVSSIADASEDYAITIDSIDAGSTPDQGQYGVMSFLSADVTAPSFLVGPTAITATTTGHTISGQIDEAGTIYAVQTAAASSAPTAAQIKLGQDSTSSAAIDSGSAVVGAEQTGEIILNGGAANTAYRYWVYAEDDEGTPNQSTPVSVDATTAAVGVSVVDVSPAIPAPGQTVVITVSGTVNATGKTLTYNGNVITVNSQDLNTLTVNSWPYPWELSAPNVDFNTNYVLRVTDAGSSGQSNVQTQPATGEDYFTVTGMATVPDESIYSNDVGLADGDKHWGYFSNGGASGSITTNGLLRNVENGAIYTYRLRDETDGLWGGSANATVFIDAADVSATLTLVDGNQNALTNLTNIQYAFFDTTDLTNMTAPSVKGTAESTNASGLLEIILSTSTLTSGQTGTLIIKDSSGRKAHYEVTVA